MPNPHIWQRRFQGYFSRWTGPREALMDIFKPDLEALECKRHLHFFNPRHPSFGEMNLLIIKGGK